MTGRMVVQFTAGSWDFPGGPMVRSLPANAEDVGLITGLGRFHMPGRNEAHAPQLLSPRSGVCTHH